MAQINSDSCHTVLRYHRLQAPFTPFLAEYFYQGLRTFVAGEDTPESVHFLMLPEPRLELIDTRMELAVSRMQSVIELGRLGRDKQTLPVKVRHKYHMNMQIRVVFSYFMQAFFVVSSERSGSGE